MKILSSADWHVNLHKKKIPQAWQTRRYELLFEALHSLEQRCDVHVISGDLFDAHPRTDDTALLFSYLNAVTIPTLVIPGNHEATAKGSSFWEHFKRDNVITNSLVHIVTDNSRVVLCGQGFQAFPYGSVQTNKLPAAVPGDILVTHIRGEVPPHITAEYDFEKLLPWKLILLGDLHFNHRYKQYPAYYPGSPVNTSFDRTDKNSYGVDIVDFRSIDNYSVEFVDLALPKLLRRTIAAGEPMLADDFHHTVYEVTGSIDQLAHVEKTELLDKKLVKARNTQSTLELSNKSIYEELELWLEHTGHADSAAALDEFKQLGIQ